MVAPKNDRDPKMDFGFYASIPRIVRTEYKGVAPLQKWAYVCLKDLCGETGTCYRTIRVLSEEIGLSVGMTSETIRVLHDAGLIHAEKKKRHTGGKEVWHITIVDIWAKNGKAHATKRSQHEQECSPHEQTTTQQDVHNTNVHHMNKKRVVCSPHEQECSHSETEEGSLSRIITEARSEGTSREQNSTAQNVATATTPAPSSPSNSSNQPTEDRNERSHSNHLSGSVAGVHDRNVSLGTQQSPLASQAKEQDRVTPAELSTLTGTSPQASAKVEPKQPVQSPSQGKNAKTRDVPPQPSRPAQNSKPQLTLLGGQVRTDYETIRACRLRLTANNIKALNTLGELDGMDFVSLKETIELIEAQNMVKERNIPIDLQALASEDGYWRFDKWYQVVLRNRKQQASKSSPPPPTSASLPSFSDMTDEEFYADARNYSNLRKGNQNVRTAHAR